MRGYLAAGGLLLFLGSTGWASGTGIIEGKVVDAHTGRPLLGANVLLVETIYGSATDETGQFVIEIPVGTYLMQVSMMGYEDRMQPDVQVDAARASRMSFELKQTVLAIEEAITVSGGYFENHADSPLSVHSLSAREIRSSPGSAEDVFRILKTIPGVSTTGSRSANLIVRGGDRNENRTLLDNIEIKSPLHFSREDASMGVISIIDPSLIDNVEFLTGGFPVEYGDKLSSVFDIRLKEGTRTQFNHDLDINMAGFKLHSDGPLPGNGNMIFSLRRGIFDLFTKMMGRSVIPRYWDAIGKLTYELDDKNKLSLVGFYYDDDAERSETMEDHDSLARKYEYGHFDDYGSAIGMNWRHLYNTSGYAVTTLDWTSEGTASHIGTNDNRDQNGDDIITHGYQLKTKTSYRLSSDLYAKAGVHLKALTSDYSRWRSADTLDTGYILPAYQTDYAFPTSYKAGGFISTTFRPVSRIAISTGLRFDHFDFTDESSWSPRGGLDYHLTDKTKLNAAWGVYHQTPSPFQICGDPANAALRSSRATHTITGVEHLLRADTRMSLEAYWKEMDEVFTPNDTTNVITNTGSGFARGLEFTVQKKMSQNLVGSLAYTWSLSRRQDAEDLPEYDFAWDRRHNLTLMTGYQPSDEWRLGVKYQYASGNPYTPVIGSLNKHGEWFAIKGEANSDRFPDYHSLDIRVDRIFRLPGWTFKVYLEVWNAFNRENVLDYYYEFDENGAVLKKVAPDFPIMPMLGLSAQF